MAPQPQSRAKAAQTVARQLARYQSMRDFHVTAEPRGVSRGRSRSTQPAQPLPFVIQKHAATRLHYDFRLGWNGVLKSWAVTKGPSFNPADKRLAVQVEDHPLEYGGFEGTIPKGQYGGGTVMVWDFGNWKPLGDVDRGLADGHLKFELEGKKLYGRWALVRMHGPREHPGKPNWLLIKDRDEFARGPDQPCITDEAPASAMTHRSIEQIAANADSVWDSVKGFQSGAGAPAQEAGQATASRNLPSAAAKKAGKAAPASSKGPDPAVSHLLRATPRESFPGFLAPQLAQQTAQAPNGSDWIHELKLDGYRIQIAIRAQKNGQRKATLYTRKGLDWTGRMPSIAAAAARLPVEDALLDGEVVALDRHGIANFADLQAAFQEGRERHLTYFAFDLLHLDGRNTRKLPLVDRKQLLAGLLAQADSNSPLHFSEHFQAPGEEVFAKACQLGAEGIVSKLAESIYDSGRGSAWLKIKCIQEQELVIGGFTPPSKGGHGIGALLLGYYRGGKLIYAGRAGTGFTEKTHRALRTQLDKLLEKEAPFAEIPREARRDAIWVKPQLVAQVAFTTWTRDNLIRQAAFKGLREDKPAREVVREMPAPVEAPEQRRTAKKSHSPTAKRAHNESHAMTELALTHPEKILDPASGMTKQGLALYYIAVAERMLPHVANRPLSVVRCPEGSSKPCFFQKHIGRGLPKGINSIAVPNRKTGEVEQYLSLNTAEGLAGMAQMGVLEIHPWGSCNERLDQPDRIVFDLDPDAAISWSTLAASAEKLRARLKKLHLESFLKCTGGKGLHLVVPIEPDLDWATVKQFAHALVLQMEAEDPALYLTKMTKAARANKIYLDYLRNDRGSTSIAAFSPRARAGAPVAMPLDWKELRAPQRPQFHVTDFPEWKSRLKRDPWRAMAGLHQRLTPEVLEAVGDWRGPREKPVDGNRQQKTKSRRLRAMLPACIHPGKNTLSVCPTGRDAISRTAQPASSRLGAAAMGAACRAPSVVKRISSSGCAARATSAQGRSAGRPSPIHSAASNVRSRPGI
jgi:bifunctional non-homologous end joining protein LigD